LPVKRRCLEGCDPGSDEERELPDVERAIGAYEAVRWPTGKVAGGKGVGTF